MGRPAKDDVATLPFVVTGTAQLPKLIAGQVGPFMLELIFDHEDGRIVDVATYPSLPGHAQLLQRLLVGCRLEEARGVGPRFCNRCRGPLVKPTLAALANAVANGKRDATYVG